MAHGRRKRAHEGGHENGERWLLTYADLITLLMVFFVVLYSMSNSDSAKMHLLTQALERAFNLGIMSGASPTALNGDGVGAASTVIQDLYTDHRFQTEVARIETKLETAVKAMGADQQAPDVAVGATTEGVVVRLSGSFLFDSGRAELKPNAMPVLNSLAAELRGSTNDLRVEGHTDDIQVDSPRYATNWELSIARSTAVVRYLAEAGGIRADRLSAAGFGEFRPAALNDTREHRALNRRVEVHILSRDPNKTEAGLRLVPTPAMVQGEQPSTISSSPNTSEPVGADSSSRLARS